MIEKIVCLKHVTGNACSGCFADEKNLNCNFDKIIPVKVRYFEVVDIKLEYERR